MISLYDIPRSSSFFHKVIVQCDVIARIICISKLFHISRTKEAIKLREFEKVFCLVILNLLCEISFINPERNSNLTINKPLSDNEYIEMIESNFFKL